MLRTPARFHMFHKKPIMQTTETTRLQTDSGRSATRGLTVVSREAGAIQASFGLGRPLVGFLANDHSLGHDEVVVPGYCHLLGYADRNLPALYPPNVPTPTSQFGVSNASAVPPFLGF